MGGDGKYLIPKMGHLKFKFNTPLMITTKRMSRPGDGHFAPPPLPPGGTTIEGTSWSTAVSCGAACSSSSAWWRSTRTAWNLSRTRPARWIGWRSTGRSCPGRGAAVPGFCSGSTGRLWNSPCLRARHRTAKCTHRLARTSGSWWPSATPWGARWPARSPSRRRPARASAPAVRASSRRRSASGAYVTTISFVIYFINIQFLLKFKMSIRCYYELTYPSFFLPSPLS